MVHDDMKFCAGNCQQVSSGQLAICLLLARSKNLLNLTSTDIHRQMHHSLPLTLRSLLWFSYNTWWIQHAYTCFCKHAGAQIYAQLRHSFGSCSQALAACCKQIFASSGVLGARWSPKVFLADGLLGRNQSQKHSMVRALAGLCDPRKNTRIAPSCEMMWNAYVVCILALVIDSSHVCSGYLMHLACQHDHLWSSWVRTKCCPTSTLVRVILSPKSANQPDSNKIE